jgi:hypothetical protein
MGWRMRRQGGASGPLRNVEEIPMNQQIDLFISTLQTF